MALPSFLDGALELPILGSPLFIVSGPELVIAQCKAGIVGSFPALNARPAGDARSEWLTQIEAELAQYRERIRARRSRRMPSTRSATRQRSPHGRHGNLREALKSRSSSPRCGHLPRSSRRRTPMVVWCFTM